MATQQRRSKYDVSVKTLYCDKLSASSWLGAMILWLRCSAKPRRHVCRPVIRVVRVIVWPAAAYTQWTVTIRGRRFIHPLSATNTHTLIQSVGLHASTDEDTRYSLEMCQYNDLIIAYDVANTIPNHTVQLAQVHVA